MTEAMSERRMSGVPRGAGQRTRVEGAPGAAPATGASVKSATLANPA